MHAVARHHLRLHLSRLGLGTPAPRHCHRHRPSNRMRDYGA